jgi:hypothetical protein
MSTRILVRRSDTLFHSMKCSPWEVMRERALVATNTGRARQALCRVMSRDVLGADKRPLHMLCYRIASPDVQKKFPNEESKAGK